MQTFLPYSDFRKSAKCLDYRRLGKQRIECKQLYFALTKDNYGWKNHSAIKMWKGYELALLEYSIEICKEWISRGYNDSQLDFFIGEYYKYLLPTNSNKYYPKWLGNKKFHKSHCSNLIRKFPEHYKKYFKNVPDNLPYIWPINER
jgi:hypothetical protein